MTLPDIISSVVTKTSTRAGVTINYMHGHPQEIVDQLALLSKAGTDNKFPLICLFHDFEEGNTKPDITDLKLQIVICTLTDPHYVAEDRYTNTFKTILQPFYEAFITELERCKYFVSGFAKHTKTDRLYWGKKGLYGNEGNVFNDFIDAIEITNLELKQLKNQC